jgi:uncharacterized protein
MEKKHFFIKLIPPRPSFAQDMSEAERALMQDHIAYWRKLLDQDIAFVFGPVMDPRGGYGIGIVEVEDESAAGNLMAADPTMKASQDFSYEIYPIRVVKK